MSRRCALIGYVCAAASVCAPGAGTWSAPRILLEHTGRYSSLEFDTAGRGHLALYDYVNGDLWYGSCEPGADWVFETVDAAPGRGWYSSLALDSAGRPHIAYSGNREWDLLHAWHDGQAWQYETIDSTGDVGLYCTLALDSADRGRICYADKDNGLTKFAW